MIRAVRAALAGLCLTCGCGAAPRVALRVVALPAQVSVDSVGPTFPSLDRTCRTLAFASAGQVYLQDLDTRTFELVSVTERGAPGGRPSGLPVLSADADRVAFDSAAHLLSGPRNRHDQIYVRDRSSRTTARASVSSDGDPANDANLGLNTGLSLSANGRYVAFSSYADNLATLDRNLSIDVFVRDLGSGTTERVSVSSSGAEAHGDSAFPSLSGDGRFVAFSSTAADLVSDDSNGARDVFLRDRSEETTVRISVAPGGVQANGDSDLPRISADGRFVVFSSDASNLVARDTNGARDVFLFDRELGSLDRISGAGGRQADGPSDHPAISEDGARIAFVSRASKLLEGTPQQVLLRDLREDRVWIASSGAEGDPGDDDSGDWGLALSGDGRCVAFASFASNLAATRPPSLFLAEIPLAPRAAADPAAASFRARGRPFLPARLPSDGASLREIGPQRGTPE